MAIFQPSNVLPDVRSGIGNGVVDATQDLVVSWRINGQSALTSFSITIYDNDAASTQKYTTGEITTGCPAYGTDSAGNPQFFSYTISAATLSSSGITNGNEYKIIIEQWWSASESITQSSASVFITRATPTLSISTIGTLGVIGTRSYTFTGNYAQAQGDVLNWLRWQIAYADDLDDPFYDSGNITGTMALSCTYDGFFTDTDYAIKLSVQTEGGVEIDTGWVSFSCSYVVPDTAGQVTAGCVGGTDAVLVEWSGIGYIPGEASGAYTLADGSVALPSGSTITWDQVVSSAMSFGTPWSIVWRGTLQYENAVLLTIGQTNDITLEYVGSTLYLWQNGMPLFLQIGFPRDATVTFVLTPTNGYIRYDRLGGGLYPKTTPAPLTPEEDLYPLDDTTPQSYTHSVAITYTQEAITSMQIGGNQVCDFVEVIKGTASADVVTAAITNGTYQPSASTDDYMLAMFENNIDGGSLSIGGDTIQNYCIYRRQGNAGRLVHIADVGNTVEKIYDYSAASQQGIYTYYLFFVGTSTYIASPLQSGSVSPCWWNWTLMECEETASENAYSVLSAYRFRLNISSGTISNNNTPNVLQNFTRYPTVQIAPQNYKSGTLTALIGAVDWSSGQPQYIDTIAWRDALYALSTSTNPLFLKNRKGDLMRIRIVAPIDMTTADETAEQMQTIALQWAEVGDASDVSLYSLDYVGVQSAQGTAVPQQYMNTYDATAVAEDIKSGKTAYARNEKLTGTADIYVENGKLNLPDGWLGIHISGS